MKIFSLPLTFRVSVLRYNQEKNKLKKDWKNQNPSNQHKGGTGQSSSIQKSKFLSLYKKH